MEICLMLGVLAFIAGMCLYGYRKGFIRIVCSLVLTIIAMIVSMLLATPVTNFIKEETPVYNTIKDQTSDYVSKYVSKNIDSATQEQKEEAINKLKLPTSIKDKLIKDTNFNVADTGAVKTFSNTLAESLADILVRALAILIIFIVIKIVLIVVMRVLDIISRLPVIHGINKNLGAAIGFVEGIFIIWVLCIALTAFSGTSVGENIIKAISNNQILSFIYNNNLLTKFLL